MEIDDVDWIEAAENYVKLHVGRSSHLVHVAMNTLEKSLDPEIFLRIHRSIIVNVGRIQELEPSLHGEYVVTLNILLDAGAKAPKVTDDLEASEPVREVLRRRVEGAP